jgi:lipopolysaccharide export LptBFGC system permease protein LptF
LLPETLKLTKHTRKDYLKRQIQRDQQPLQQQQQQQELVELSSLSSRDSVSEQQQDEEEIITTVTTCDNTDNNVAVIPKTQNEQIAILEDKDTIIKNLEKKIEELQEEIRYLRDGSSAQRQQPQEEETFTALGYLQLYDNDVPIKVTINIKTKSIEAMEIAHEIIQNAKTH